MRRTYLSKVHTRFHGKRVIAKLNRATTGEYGGKIRGVNGGGMKTEIIPHDNDHRGTGLMQSKERGV